MKRIHWISAILFILIMAGCILVFILMPDSTYSSKEKRNLAAFPELTLSSVEDGSFMTAIEDYTADQFPFRDTMMTLKTSLTKLIGIRESHGVYACTNDSYVERFDTPDESNMVETANAVSAFCEKYRDADIYFALVPNAISIYPEVLPPNALTEDQGAYIHAFYEMLPRSVNTLDVIGLFSEIKSVHQLYYRTDHHWTSDAAYEAFKLFSEAASLENVPNFVPGTICNTFFGSMLSESGFSASTPDIIDVYFPESENDPTLAYTVNYIAEGTRTGSIYDTEALLGNDPYQVFFGGNHAQIQIDTICETERSLLLIKDSYANAFIPFLIPSYTSITIVDPRYYYDNIDALVVSKNFDDILFLYNVNTFAEDTNLKTVLRNEQ